MSVGHHGDRQCTTKKECSRDTITQKVPAYPLETKVGSTAGVKFLCDRILTCRHTLSGKSL